MKKNRWAAMLCAAVCALALAACGGDSGPSEKTIVLEYGQPEAYFAASVALRPIAGIIPAADDRVERASVVLKADRPAVLRLSVRTESEPIEGLMIQADGYAAVEIASGAVVYTSAAPETEVTLSVAVYLAADAPETGAGKTVAFDFVLESEEADV